jgi:type II secretory pathway component PulF
MKTKETVTLNEWERIKQLYSKVKRWLIYPVCLLILTFAWFYGLNTALIIIMSCVFVIVVVKNINSFTKFIQTSPTAAIKKKRITILCSIGLFLIAFAFVTKFWLINTEWGQYIQGLFYHTNNITIVPGPGTLPPID